MKTYKSSDLIHKRSEVMREAETNGVVIQQCRTNGEVMKELVLVSKDKYMGINETEEYKPLDFSDNINEPKEECIVMGNGGSIHYGADGSEIFIPHTKEEFDDLQRKMTNHINSEIDGLMSKNKPNRIVSPDRFKKAIGEALSKHLDDEEGE